MNFDHRPWPPPDRPWIMAQSWRDLLFAHWPLPAADLRHLVPSSLQLDLWSDEAWLGIVPFRMEGVRVRGLLPIPGLSSTPEINVRTYVIVNRKPGVYFFSLDASSRFAVRVARRFFHLPYFDARMGVRRDGDWIRYITSRNDNSSARAEFRGSYRASGSVARAQPGTFDNWLTERYCFYTLDSTGVVIRGDIHHDPWPLQPAEVSIELNTMADPLGLQIPNMAPIAHFAQRQDVIVWTPEKVLPESSAAA